MHTTLKLKRAISTKNFAREAKESHLNSKTYALIEFPPVLICSCVCSPLVFGVHADFWLEQFGSFWIFSGAQFCLASSKFVVFIAHINQKASNVKAISPQNFATLSQDHKYQDASHFNRNNNYQC